MLAADSGVREFGARGAMSRGEQIAGGGVKPRGWAFAVPVDAHIITAQTQGISTVSLGRGCNAYNSSKTPWLLIGAKTLSYAVNQAAGRYAAERGADEALFVSHDGIVLEGPTANLDIRRGQRLQTPDPTAGLLSGTTQRLLFDHTSELGLRAEYADLSLDGNPIKIDAKLTEIFQMMIQAG